MEETKSTAWTSLIIGLVFTVAVVLIILRAFGVIRCSWWLATALVWAPAVLIVLSLIVAWIAFAIQETRKRKKGKE